jgi:hypothetical protein
MKPESIWGDLLRTAGSEQSARHALDAHLKRQGTRDKISGRRSLGRSRTPPPLMPLLLLLSLLHPVPGRPACCCKL